MSVGGSQNAQPRPGDSRRSGRRQALRLIAAAGAAALCARARPGRAAAAASAADPKSFIDQLGAEVLSIIRAPNLSQAQRQERFRGLFSQNFDVPTIGRFVVGRYWNRASPAEQQQYLDTFRNYVAAIYADQFSRYKGQGFKTESARSLGGDETLVRAVIERSSEAPINVNFRVKGTPGSFKIDDVTVENVSLIVTKRDEFASLLVQGGIKGVTERMQAILKNTQQAG